VLVELPLIRHFFYTCLIQFILAVGWSLSKIACICICWYSQPSRLELKKLLPLCPVALIQALMMTMTWMTENIHQRIALNFGKNIFRMVREYEKLSRKFANYRNHLHFNLRCGKHRVIPISVQLSSNIRGHRAGQIPLKAQNQLNKRIRQVHFPLTHLFRRWIWLAKNSQHFYLIRSQRRSTGTHLHPSVKHMMTPQTWTFKTTGLRTYQIVTSPNQKRPKDSTSPFLNNCQWWISLQLLNLP